MRSDHLDSTSESYEGGVNFRSESQEPYVPKPLEFKFYAIFLVQCVVLVLGAVGNGLLVLTLTQHKHLRTPTNTYILSIAISDLLVTLSCPTVMIITDLAGGWTLGEIPCKLSQATMEFSTCATVLTLTTVSVERYYAVVHPFKTFISTQRSAIAANLLIWMVAMLFAVPKFWISAVVPDRVNGTQGHTDVPLCVLTDNSFILTKHYLLFQFIMFYALPLYIVCCLYMIVARHLMKCPKASNFRMSSGRLNRDQMRNRAARMVIVLTIIFFVGFTPYNIVRVRLFFLGGLDEYWETAAAYTYCFGCLHFWLNPLAMYRMSNTFRKHFNSYLFCSPLPPKRDMTISRSKDQSYPQETFVMNVSTSERFSAVN